MTIVLSLFYSANNQTLKTMFSSELELYNRNSLAKSHQAFPLAYLATRSVTMSVEKGLKTLWLNGIMCEKMSGAVDFDHGQQTAMMFCGGIDKIL